ncbi:hypothetical protein [Actinopolymorpha pittospori]|uniref:Uncharacterized protein n=1 Tax=Actinopolymorpha pittospori TaxID=648752 RepID=A0A927MY69_9ACTN|nr:hypothetical protein [Actinopolymorpha pittospori]MBE1609111.1 hypothetical protein [Actinopolymorpha pittospori]
MKARVDDLLAAFGELLVELDIDNDPTEPVAELGRLLARPWSDHRRDPAACRSALTRSGAPFELSLKLDMGGDPSLRYVVDTADHALDLSGNLERYLDAARMTTGQPDGVLRQLLDCHLHDVPPGTKGTVMHGVGRAGGGRRRSSLYVPASWLVADDLEKRLPGPVPLPRPAEVVGYDFGAGGLTCWKTYHWLSVEPGRVLADHPDPLRNLTYAGQVYDRFSAAVPDSARGMSTFLQRKVDGNGTQDKLFFFAGPWGWAGPDGLADLLAFLSGVVAVDLGPLRLVSALTRRHQVNLHLGLLAVGGETSPSVTFYLWPT